jgi:uncharacterized membrane protein YqhA
MSLLLGYAISGVTPCDRFAGAEPAETADNCRKRRRIHPRSTNDMNPWKKGLETALWNGRLIVVLAVISSILAAIALFFIFGIESFRVLADLLRYLDPTLAPEQREALLKRCIVREISAIDGYLLGAFMLIFGFGLYELFVADLQEARSSQTAGRILRIRSLDDLKTRLGKVILIILIAEAFKDAFELKAQTPLELLYIGATIALIGLALYLTHGSESEKNPEPARPDKTRN